MLAGVGALALAATLGPVAAASASTSAAQPAAHQLKPRTHGATPNTVIPGPLTNHGGPVQNAPRVYVDFWGWTSDPSGEQAYLTRFLSSVGGSAWLTTVNQYGGGSGAGLLGGTWSDGAAVPSVPTDAQIQAEAAAAANHFGTGTSANVQIVVATPTGHSTAGFGSQYCAYHGVVSSLPNVTYTDLPYIPDAGAGCGADMVNGSAGALDGVSIVEGHEMAESITDPLLNAWIDASGYEIGDKCAWSGLGNITTSAGRFAVQPLWSNANNGCVSFEDGTFVAVQQNGQVFRMVGGAPVYVSTWSAYGGAQPTTSIGQAQLAAMPTFPANGTLINGAQTGQVYVVAGGAPVYVSTWATYGGVQPTTTVDQAAIDNAGAGGQWNHLNVHPANGTLINGAQTGQVYVVAGGGAIYVSTWATYGGAQPTTTVDQAAINNAGTGGLWNHLNAKPANGTLITGAQTGQVYVVAGGAPIYVSTWSTFGGPQPSTIVDQAALDNAGTGGLWNRLNAVPANGTFLLGAQTGRVYIVNSGTPTYVPSWGPYGGPQPTTTVDQAAIDNAGAGGVWKHLL